MVIVKQILYVNIPAIISSQKRNIGKLVCEEQSQTNENKQLLEEYKSRCIFKQKANLPEYSNEIKLSFHASNSIPINNKLQQTIHLTQWASDIQDKTIYILQTIDVNNQNNTISFTTVDVGIWCHQGIQQSNVQEEELNRNTEDLVQLGVGVNAESKYGMYQVKQAAFLLWIWCNFVRRLFRKNNWIISHIPTSGKSR